MNIAEINAHLDDVTIKQMTWKPGAMQSIGCRITKAALAGEVWPDEVDMETVAELDRNCIGPCWRNLRKAGIIEQTGDYRQSESGHAKGRIVFKYKLASRKLAQTFLACNGQPEPKQIKPQPQYQEQNLL